MVTRTTLFNVFGELELTPHANTPKGTAILGRVAATPKAAANALKVAAEYFEQVAPSYLAELNRVTAQKKPRRKLQMGECAVRRDSTWRIACQRACTGGHEGVLPVHFLRDALTKRGCQGTVPLGHFAAVREAEACFARRWHEQASRCRASAEAWQVDCVERGSGIASSRGK